MVLRIECWGIQKRMLRFAYHFLSFSAVPAVPVKFIVTPFIWGNGVFAKIFLKTVENGFYPQTRVCNCAVSLHGTESLSPFFFPKGTLKLGNRLKSWLAMFYSFN